MANLLVGPLYIDGVDRAVPRKFVGPPVNGTTGTFAGVAGIGDLIVDSVNAITYQNTGTVASPVWSLIQALSVQDTITAGTTQTQAGATQLTAAVSRVSVNATIGNGARLPVSFAGSEFIVINATTNALQVYGGGTDTINLVATATGVSIPAAKTAQFNCVTAGESHMFLSA